jgi:hypothetical protein
MCFLGVLVLGLLSTGVIAALRMVGRVGSTIPIRHKVELSQCPRGGSGAPRIRHRLERVPGQVRILASGWIWLIDQLERIVGSSRPGTRPFIGEIARSPCIDRRGGNCEFAPGRVRGLASGFGAHLSRTATSERVGDR